MDAAIAVQRGDDLALHGRQRDELVVVSQPEVTKSSYAGHRASLGVH
jgi:hypothetical protein